MAQKQQNQNQQSRGGDPNARSPAGVAQALKGIDFPQDKQGIRRHAEQNGASQAILDRIDQMPDGDYSSMASVFEGVGEAVQRQADR